MSGTEKKIKKMKVGRVEDVQENHAVGVEVEGISLLIVKKDGKIYVFEDRCSHQEMPISENYDLEGGKLICMWHGAEFDLETGKNLSMPAPAPIKKFETEINNNGEIFVIIEE
jgi:nitrite reductase/ring-hydroxylating ferredoxin subunit